MKNGLPGSFACWPPMPAQPRERGLATTTRSGRLLLMGRTPVPVSCWQEFKERVEELDLEVLCGPLPAWRWWQDAVDDPDTYISLGRRGAPRAVILEGRRHKRWWMVDSSVWGRRPDASLCRDLSILGEATGMGQWSTPSRLGDALQRREWVGERGWRLESRPNAFGRQLLLETGVGGRGETLELGAKVPHCWEIDQRDAYAAAWALPKPHGRALRTFDSTRVGAGAATAYGPVRFRILQRLGCPGPLPIRGEDGNLAWPTEPGTYFTHAWAEEVADARACGIEVSPAGAGVEWSSWVRSGLWTRRVSELRRTAGGWGSLLKLATVASIGRHGRRPSGWVQLQRQERPGDLTFSGTVDKWHGERPLDLPAMTHWYSYALMQARRRVWHRAVAEQWAGRRVVAIETDSLVLDGPPLGPVVKRGEDGPGEWSIRREDQTCYTPVTRWAIFSDGSGRTPGLPFELRASWLDAHPPPGPSG